jgi:hypothetical protein
MTIKIKTKAEYDSAPNHVGSPRAVAGVLFLGCATNPTSWSVNKDEMPIVRDRSNIWRSDRDWAWACRACEMNRFYYRYIATVMSNFMYKVPLSLPHRPIRRRLKRLL